MSTEMQDGREITHSFDGAVYRIFGRAWWLASAVENPNGRIVVARINAESMTLRKPSQAQLDADPTLNRYWVDASNEGELAIYMLEFTDDDLCRLGITPGNLVYPHVEDAPRPKSNNTHMPVSWRKVRQAMDWLQNDCIGQPSDYATSNTVNPERPRSI
jgi:hypothetical protein